MIKWILIIWSIVGFVHYAYLYTTDDLDDIKNKTKKNILYIMSGPAIWIIVLMSRHLRGSGDIWKLVFQKPYTNFIEWFKKSEEETDYE